MEKNHTSGTKVKPGSMSNATNGSNFGDIFICGTAKACAVKNCFKRTTHYHCSLCPDRRLVKGQNMVAHQIFHVNGRLENRSIRDNHFIAYTGACGRPSCRFHVANKKHHHCKLCDWPCCGRKLQRCSGHVKSKHPEVFDDEPLPSQVLASPHKMVNCLEKTNFDDTNTEDEATDVKNEDEPEKSVKMDEEEEDFHSEEIIHVQRSDEQENMKSVSWAASIQNHGASSSANKPPKVNSSNGDRVKVVKELPVDDSMMLDDENVLGEFDSGKEDLSKDKTGCVSGNITNSCEYSNCQDNQNHLHCNLCEFVTNKKHLLDRHQNIHARGFHEKRKQREMYFNGSTGQCDVPECRFSPLKQRHFHCKLCGWACSSRKLQRCIKHIIDKHKVDLNSSVRADEKPVESNTVPVDNSTPLLAMNTSTASSQDDVEEEPESVNESENLNDLTFVPPEDDLFLTSTAEVTCDVDKCFLQGLHYHCRRCPFATRQKRSRVRHRAIHLKGYPERRMIRDLHFLVYDGICGRTCRFSVPKRKHFHCKYCDWPCCARKMPRCLNHLRRKHADVLDEEEECMTQSPVSLKRMREDSQDETSLKNNGKQQKRVKEKSTDSDAEQPNRVIILEEENTDCPFVIKDVHSLRNSSMENEVSPHRAVNGSRNLHVNSYHAMEAEDRLRDRRPSVPSYESSFKQYKRPPAMNGPVFGLNGHGYPMHHPERPVICRVCRAFANERLPLRKMVVYSTSNRLELDLRLTSLLCTYFHVSIEDAFNSYICERDFDDWCNFHAQKISVYPVIAVENGCDATHNPRVVPMEEQYSQY